MGEDDADGVQLQGTFRRGPGSVATLDGDRPDPGDAGQCRKRPQRASRRDVRAILGAGKPGRWNRFEHFYDEENGEIDTKLRGVICYSPTGQACGYAVYTVADGDPVLSVKDMDFLEPRAEIALWDHLVRVEGVRTIKLETFSLESPLRLCLKDLRAVDIKSVFDLLWARVLDPVQCLEARSYSFAARSAGLEARFRVEDPLGYAAGSLRLTLSAEGATAKKLEDDAEVEAVLNVNALAELVYASSSVSNLEVAGMITGLAPKARPRWESLFAPASPATFKNHF